MRRLSTVVLAVVGVCTMAIGRFAAADVESGPDVGSAVVPLNVIPTLGDDAGKKLDPLKPRAAQTTVVVLVNGARWDRPTARYLKTLDQQVGTFGKDVSIIVVWVTDDLEKTKEYLPKAQMSLKFEQTLLTVSPDGVAGPENWGLNDRASVTTVITRASKVHAKFAYVSLNETNVPDVMKAVKAATPQG